MKSILDKQKMWAENKGLLYRNAYLDSFQSNLFLPLDGVEKDSFEKGSGSELKDKRGEKAKMKALISSSALCVNFFLYLKQNGLLPSFLETIEIRNVNVVGAEFEKKLQTGASSAKANLDFYIECNDRVIGIESKFTEHYNKEHDPLKQSYLEKKNKWQLKDKYSKPFPHLAKWINNWEIGKYYDSKNKKAYTGRFSSFEYLDAAQLIKHLFALNNDEDVKEPFTLLYIHYDTQCEEIDKHEKELTKFRSILEKDNVSFISVSYQSIFAKLKEDLRNNPVHTDYLNYMTSRYSL